jgi:hypothetical protein
VLEGIYTGGLCITCILATPGTIATGCGPSILSHLPTESGIVSKVKIRISEREHFAVRIHHPPRELTQSNLRP